MGMGDHEKPNKGATDNWLTPIEIVRALGPFNLDPCGQTNHRTAHRILTEKSRRGPDDWKKWEGRVWLNPPYSEVGEWLEALRLHARKNKGSGIALVFARVDTKWAQFYMNQADSVFFLKGRIRFLDTNKVPGKWTGGAPSMFLAFGEKPDWDRALWTIGREGLVL